MYCYHRWVKRELHCSSRRLLRETDKELLPVLWAYFPLLHICRQFGEEKLHSRFVQNQGAVEISERQNPSCPSFSWLWWLLYAELVHHSCTLLKCRNCWCTGFKVPFFCCLVLAGERRGGSQGEQSRCVGTKVHMRRCNVNTVLSIVKLRCLGGFE